MIAGARFYQETFTAPAKVKWLMTAATELDSLPQQPTLWLMEI